MRHEEAFPRLVELIGLRAASLDDRALRSHCDECAECTERLAALERVAAGLAQVRANPTPLPHGLAERVRAVPAQVDRVRRRSWRRRFAIGVPSLVATAAAAIVLLLVTGTPERAFTLDQRVALHALTTSGPEGMAEVSRPTGQFRIVRLNVHGLPREREQTYDLWMMDDKGAMKAGTFGPDPDGACEVEMMVPAGEKWTHLAITKSGASPNGPLLASS